MPKAAAKSNEQGPPRPPLLFHKFNDIPIELQKDIFKMAYQLSQEEGFENQIKWSCISRAVREWIDPLLYDSIVLPDDFEYGSRHDGGATRLKRYERTFKTKPKEFYIQNVRRIYTNNSTRFRSSDFELELLSICDNLRSLECWSSPREELQTILRTKSWPMLESLSIDLDLLPLDENIFRLPLFHNITYLDFCTKKPQLPSWKSLQSLDNLTHVRVFLVGELGRREFRLAMDQTYSVASEAQKHFPPNLKYFVILVPFDILCYAVIAERETAEDKQRWERMESIRVGTFDPRIMLGCSGNWDDWLDEMGDEVEDDAVDGVIEYTRLMSVITYQRWPRDHISTQLEDDPDVWGEIEEKHQKRKEFLTSQGK